MSINQCHMACYVTYDMTNLTTNVSFVIDLPDSEFEGSYNHANELEE